MIGSIAPSEGSRDERRNGVAARSDTVDRILDGAVRALARHGHRKFSMSDVSEQAGVSRGTLYRYFKNRDELLEAIAVHVRERTREELVEAVAEQPEPEHRLRTVLDVVIRSGWLHPESMRILDIEPAFAQSFIREVFPQFIELVADSLEPAADHIPVLRDRRLTVKQLAELVLRVGASAFYVPSPDAAQLPDWMEELASPSGEGPGPRRKPKTRPRPASVAG
jgi:AcrR family transcriptional regulator